MDKVHRVGSWTGGPSFVYVPFGLQNKNNYKMEILLPMEGGGGGNKGTAVKQVSIVNLFDITLKHLNYFFIDF